MILGEPEFKGAGINDVVQGKDMIFQVAVKCGGLAANVKKLLTASALICYNHL